MKERPIIFSAPMIRAILAGTKTQTRRVVKPQPPAWHSFAGWCVASTCRTDEGKATWAAGISPHLRDAHRVACPYGQPGDRLWVREAFSHFERNETFKLGCKVFYRADGECVELEPWRPSIHMPRWASRITLEITEVRVERSHDISVADCMAEGVVECNANLQGLGPCLEWRYAYEDLWESINGPGSWDANPWIWVIEFRRVAA